MALISEESKDLLQAQAELYNQVLSYMKSVALAVALDLRIADAIHHHGGAATVSQIAGEIGVNPCKTPALRRLMRVLTVAGTFTIIQPSEQQQTEEATLSSAGHGPPAAAAAAASAVYKLTTACRLLISDSSPSFYPTLSQQLNSFRDSVLSMGLSTWFRYDDEAEQPGPCPFTLRHGGTTFWEKSERDHAANALFNDSMAADSHFLMQVVLKEFSEIFHGVESLVDVGGGVGGAAIAVAAAFPSMKCSVLDLPHVVAKAPADASNNVQFVAGDMFKSIPRANIVFLKWIFHGFGDDECIKILKNCKRAIPSRDAGGKVIIVEIVVGSMPSDTKLLETQVLCDLNMMKVGGAERDEQEWKKLFLEAGFKDYNVMPVLGLRSIIEVYP